MAARAALDLLLFELEDRRLALPTRVVREVVRAVAVRPLPRAPAVVEGLIDVRGQVVPVFDLRRRFRLTPRPLGLSEQLIIAETQRRVVAVRADRTIDVVAVDPAQVHDPRAVVPDADQVAGVVTLPDGLVLIHDLDTFLTQAEAATLEAALAEAP
jgi:purine-binding chemotaxis protein CheW